MPQARFIQIHTLQSYPAALLNRDDAGLAKRLPMGDAIRTRISSQCLKRHWRVADDHHSLAAQNTSGWDVIRYVVTLCEWLLMNDLGRSRPE